METVSVVGLDELNDSFFASENGCMIRLSLVVQFDELHDRRTRQYAGSDEEAAS